MAVSVLLPAPLVPHKQGSTVRPGDAGRVQHGDPLALMMAGQHEPPECFAAGDHHVGGGQHMPTVFVKLIAAADAPCFEHRHALLADPAHRRLGKRPLSHRPAWPAGVAIVGAGPV